MTVGSWLTFIRLPTQWSDSSPKEASSCLILVTLSTMPLARSLTCSTHRVSPRPTSSILMPLIVRTAAVGKSSFFKNFDWIISLVFIPTSYCQFSDHVLCAVLAICSCQYLSSFSICAHPSFISDRSWFVYLRRRIHDVPALAAGFE